MNWILQWKPFDVVSIIYTSILSYMGHARECIQYPRTAKSVLVLPSLIVQIYLNLGVDFLSTNTVTYRMEVFIDTTVRSMSLRPDQLPSLTPKNNSLPNCRSDSGDAGSSIQRVRSRTRRIIILDNLPF